MAVDEVQSQPIGSYSPPLRRSKSIVTHAIEFDFAQHVDRVLTLSEVDESLKQGHSCWVDIDLSCSRDAEQAIETLVINPRVVESLAHEPSIGRHDVHEDCLHISISIPVYTNRQLRFEIVELILAERLIITLHRGEMQFLNRVQESYPNFFRKFALSLGFLLFEIWDLLIESLRGVLTQIEDDVEETQKSIFSGASDEIFPRVSQLSANVLELRKNVVAMRDVLDHLATHKSAFVPATAQPYLLNLVGSLERLSLDLTVERETLAESLTLYLGIVSHRTNQLVNRLTLVSMVFLPLTFLCGVYGMNLDLPEYRWRYGYAYFWGLAVCCATAMVIWMRMRRLW